MKSTPSPKETASRELIHSLEVTSAQYQEILSHYHDDGSSRSRQLTRLIQTLSDIHDEVVELRMLKILREERPYLPLLRIDVIEQQTPYRGYSLPEICTTFIDIRKRLLAFLSKIPEDKWNRTGVHEVEGHITFRELVRRLVNKDHLVIERLNRELNLATPAELPVPVKRMGNAAPGV